jgi:hypothetical protein
MLRSSSAFYGDALYDAIVWQLEGSVVTVTVAWLADSHCGVWQHCAQVTCKRDKTGVHCGCSYSTEAIGVSFAF